VRPNATAEHVTIVLTFFMTTPLCGAH
jgi:hypothetical protein